MTKTSTRQTRPKNGQAMNRVTHLLFGHGEVLEKRVTESGQSVSLVRFDSSTDGRLFLTSSLKPSSVPVDSGEAPKKGKKKAAPVKGASRRKTALPSAEAVSDQLLVSELDETLTETVAEESEETEVL